VIASLLKRLLHKLAHRAPGGYSLRVWLHRWRGVKIGANAWISQFVYIDELHPEAVTIGENATIGIRSSIFTHFYWGPRRSKNGYREVVIERDVFVGPHCLILPGVRIGEGAVIKAGSVVTRDVPPYTFWGPPAAGPLGRVTTPLTAAHSYDDFVRGLRPLRAKRAQAWAEVTGTGEHGHPHPGPLPQGRGNDYAQGDRSGRSRAPSMSSAGQTPLPVREDDNG
jgi:acetyltransferase-like isoleucine patch superfamily enzyme